MDTVWPRNFFNNALPFWCCLQRFWQYLTPSNILHPWCKDLWNFGAQISWEAKSSAAYTLIFCNLYSSDTLPANEKHFFPNSEAAYIPKFWKGRTECPVTFESPTFFCAKKFFFSTRAPNFYCAKEWQSWKKVFTKQINAVFGVFSKTLTFTSLNNSQI